MSFKKAQKMSKKHFWVKPVKPHPRSLNSYARSVFRESSIGMVSSIAATYNRNRKLFKSLILFLCLFGFLYQCSTFLEVVFKYPTTVGIVIERPKKIDVPAYTFCNNNGVKRSVYCSTFPTRCTEANETFCAKHPTFCGKNKTLVLIKEYQNIEETLYYRDMLAIGDNLSDFLRGNVNPFKDAPEGPYLRSKDLRNGGMFCYTLHSVVASYEKPLQIERTLRKGASRMDIFGTYSTPSNTFAFYIDESELLTPENKPGMLFSVHSAYEAVNPYDKGTYLKPGRQYKIFVEMTHEFLLQKPYDTDCINYLDRWEKNNRSGPRIQEMCRHKCLLDLSLNCLGCKFPLLLYPSNHRICTRDEFLDKECPSAMKVTHERCLDQCKQGCQTIKYSYRVMERFDAKYSILGEPMENMDRYVSVEVYLEAGEVMVLQHTPKYMTVEIFSAIGGFIGCWLGISLMDIADVLENFYRILTYFFKKKRSHKK